MGLALLENKMSFIKTFNKKIKDNCYIDKESKIVYRAILLETTFNKESMNEMFIHLENVDFPERKIIIPANEFIRCFRQIKNV
jgi:hypothetical protein